MRFTKMQGLGNDYLYVDCIHHPPPKNLAQLSKAMSDRHFGVGADGLILDQEATGDASPAFAHSPTIVKYRLTLSLPTHTDGPRRACVSRAPPALPWRHPDSGGWR